MRAIVTDGSSKLNMTVTGRNIELTPSLKEYLIDKLRRAQNHFDQPLEVTA
jgi:ribosome-associated translation inhibitor RaiA